MDICLLIIGLAIVDNLIQFANVKLLREEAITFAKVSGSCVLVGYLHGEVGREPSPL